MILTDGHENSSKEFDRAKVMALIKHQTETYSWQFLFLGANQDAIAAGASIGVAASNAMSYAGTGVGVGARGAASTHDGGTKSITSSLTRNFPPSDSTPETWLSFVLDATSSFIPEGTPLGNSFKVVLDVESEWTLVPYRGKPAADGPRYKAVGNSMSINAMRWLGVRIKIVSALRTTQ